MVCYVDKYYANKKIILNKYKGKYESKNII